MIVIPEAELSGAAPRIDDRTNQVDLVSYMTRARHQKGGLNMRVFLIAMLTAGALGAVGTGNAAAAPAKPASSMAKVAGSGMTTKLAIDWPMSTAPLT